MGVCEEARTSIWQPAGPGGTERDGGHSMRGCPARVLGATAVYRGRSGANIGDRSGDFRPRK